LFFHLGFGLFVAWGGGPPGAGAPHAAISSAIDSNMLRWRTYRPIAHLLYERLLSAA
jgi:hypothetical protein